MASDTSEVRFAPSAFQASFDRYGIDVDAVADQPGDDVVVGERGADRARGPVIEGLHRVEQVGDVPEPRSLGRGQHRRCHRRVARSNRDATGREPLDQLDGTVEFGSERDHRNTTGIDPVGHFGGEVIGADDVRGRVGAEPPG